MKALELLNIIYNGNAEIERDIELVESYARLQIEKDRERVIQLHIEHGIPEDAPILELIRNLPIILD